MKKISLLFILSVVVILGCDQKQKSNQTSDALAQKNISKEEKLISENGIGNSTNLTSNEIVLEQLQQMKLAIKEKNSEKLCQFFDFPVQLNEPFMLFVPYDKLLERWPNSQVITKYDFLELVNTDEEEQLYALLTTLDVTLLKNTYVIEKDIEVKDDVCTYLYSINVRNDKVTLMYGTNSSIYATDDDWCAESNTFITFKIIGNKIIFDEYVVAG